MSVTLRKYIMQAVRIVGPLNLLLLSGLALVQMKAYDQYSPSEFALRVDTFLYRTGFGVLLMTWVLASPLLIVVFVVVWLALWRRFPPDERLSRREFPGMAATLFGIWFGWHWGLSEGVKAHQLYAACVAFLVTSALWLVDALMSSPRTQHRDP